MDKANTTSITFKQNDKARFDGLYNRIISHLEHSHNRILRSVNTEMVKTYWLIGREIVEEEQEGKERAA